MTRGRVAASVGAALIVLIGCAVVALVLGMRDLSLSDALSVAGGRDREALTQLVLPRIAMGMLVGAILGLSGAALQGLLRNPLADPFILGVSGGAAVGSTLALMLGASMALAAPLGGFAGALGALVIVTALALERGTISPLKMLLIGVIVNALAGAVLMVLHTLADPATVQLTLVRLMGSVAADPSRPELMPVIGATLGIAAVAVMASARQLNLLALGDETARSLGVEPDRLRLKLFVALSIPIGAAVAVTGLIGFVGLIVPHAVRRVAGPDHRLLLPLSALVGAASVVLADGAVAALRGPLATELPVGVVTALVGGPIFLAMLRLGRGPDGVPS